jgi:hypothetical protein
LSLSEELSVTAKSLFSPSDTAKISERHSQSRWLLVEVVAALRVVETAILNRYLIGIFNGQILRF